MPAGASRRRRDRRRVRLQLDDRDPGRDDGRRPRRAAGARAVAVAVRPAGWLVAMPWAAVLLGLAGLCRGRGVPVWRGELRWRGPGAAPAAAGDRRAAARAGRPRLVLRRPGPVGAAAGRGGGRPGSTFLALFVTAPLPGAIFSHVPAGLGVFEAVILCPARQAGPARHRRRPGGLPDHLLPAAAARAGGLASRLRPGWRRRAGWCRRLAARARRRLVLPNLLAPLVGVCGIVLLVSGVTPAEQDAHGRARPAVPLALVERGALPGQPVRPGPAAAGAGPAPPPRRRLVGRRASCWRPASLSRCSRASTGRRRCCLALVLALLLPSRRAFYRRSALTAQRFSPSWLVGDPGRAGQRHLARLLRLPPRRVRAAAVVAVRARADAPRFLRATAGCCPGCCWRWHRPAASATPGRATAPADDGRARARRRRHRAAPRRPPSSAWVALLGDKRLLFSDSGRSFVMYGVQGRSWIAMGEPIGLRAERRELLWRFRELADALGARCAFYEIAARGDARPGRSRPRLPEARRGGVRAARATSRSRAASARACARRCNRGRARRCDLRDRSASEGVPPSSTSWRRSRRLARRQGRAREGLLGRPLRSRLPRPQPVAVVRRDGELVAFANVWTTAGPGRAVDRPDALRRRTRRAT